MSLSPDFVSELRKHFSGDIRTDQTSLTLYSTDASVYQIEPLGVVIPRHQEDLIAVMELAARYRVPVLPRGSGSSLAGQAIGQALILDCSRFLDNIPIPIDVENKTAVVEPGVILSSLNKMAARHGLMFGPDPASAERATMGGVIGNNATGAHSILYGMTADHLLSAEVILADGSLAHWGLVDDKVTIKGVDRHSEILSAALKIRTGYADPIRKNWPKTWRNSAGYRLNYLLPWSASSPEQWVGENYPPVDRSMDFNLSSLLAGSEGTLAIIRSATIRLVNKPKFTILGVLSFDSVATACDAVPYLLEKNPSAVELVPQMLIRLARSVPAYASQLGFVRGDPAALLVVEFSGDNPEDLRTKVKDLGQNVLIAESQADQAKVWAVRKVGLGIFDSRPSEERPVAFIEDCAIPVERLGEFVREVEKILSTYGTQAAFYAHASAGCLHIRPILNMKSGLGLHQFRAIAQEVLKLTLQVGGAMSSEHGDGLVRAEWLRQTYGAQVLEAMQLLKTAADPDELLNPRKMTTAPSMDANLRYGVGYQSKIWAANLDFSRSGGLAAAVEQCNGQGVCRKQDGVMCPSFQATREEINSTRGRANLLRALIMIGPNRVEEDQVKQALDLCLACKGCKAECPSGVDMARLKYEFQSHYYENHTRPWRDFLFGYIGTFAMLGAPFGRIINMLTGTDLFRKIANHYLGISHQRVLPQFQSPMKILKSLKRHPSNRQPHSFLEDCLFLPDTFTHYFEPEIEQAALRVLYACGINVKRLPVFGAGRTLLSKGFITPARNHAENLLNRINKMDPAGILPVVGLEPSEIYTLRDEFFDLLPNRRDEVKRLAARTWLIDEFLVRNSPGASGMRVGRADLSNPVEKEGSILLHSHCYQKAQPPNPDGFSVGVNASADLLRAAGYDVEVMNTGCCGMAGAFGYEEEHYALSMQVGDLKLFPEITNKCKQNDNTQIVALGTSCRSQISDGTGIKSRHSILLVSQKLNGFD